ncbi:MAG: folylpolyglutamate synthase/dihydrofolate synthase family protein [Thermacetogeniaceae bacterium]
MLSSMSYDEALDFLVGLTKFGFNFGLQRIECLLQLLGDPHRKLRVIHIGGTNGKGSTAMMTASVLDAAGYRVGLFTSPHLDSYTERYLINRVPISEPELAELISRVRPHLEQMVRDGHEHPTEFEVCTAIAFLYFSEEQVDFLVLEVGLGGAIDSTNIIPTPLAAVITNVAFDHIDYLGNTIKDIATVKAGIIKQGGYAVTAAFDQEALDVIMARCREVGASLLRVGVDLGYELIESTPSGTSFNLRSPWGDYPAQWAPLAGQYQAINAATALGVIEVLRRRHGVQITAEQIRAGLAAARWPARLELLSESPAVLVDVTHNHDGSRKLREALQEIYHYRRLILVLGMLGDKEREKVVGELAPLASLVVITKPNSPRAGDWELLATEARRYVDHVLQVEEITAAVDAALKEAGCEDLVCVTGSFYMVAEARAYLRRKLQISGKTLAVSGTATAIPVIQQLQSKSTS